MVVAAMVWRRVGYSRGRRVRHTRQFSQYEYRVAAGPRGALG
jgi:hypothetical protein